MAAVLNHHGVKGQKWGVVNEDDRAGLASEFKSFSDKQKYGSMNDPEEKIEDQGFFKSLTPAQKKAALIFGGAVVVAGLAYGTSRYNLNTKSLIDPRTLLEDDPFAAFSGPHKEGLKAYLDRGIELPNGSLVARVSKDIETNIRPGGFYAAHEYHDIESYKGFLGRIGGHTNYFKATQEIKAPSTKEYVRLLGKAMDTPEVLKARGVNTKLLGKMAASDREKVLLNLAKEELSKRDFAFSLNASTIDGQLPSRFVKQVLGAGYTSVVDYNNASGATAQAPLRHLNGKMFKFFSSEEITAEVKQLAVLNTEANMEKIGSFYDAVSHWARLSIRGLFDGNKKVGELMTQNILESELTHFGVKGQKWGVRKDGKSSQMSSDASRHAANRGKRVHELSDAELRDLVGRINMEQQVGRLNPGKVQKGHDRAKMILAIGATANTAIAFAKSPAGKAVGSGLADAASKLVKFPVGSIGVTK